MSQTWRSRQAQSSPEDGIPNSETIQTANPEGLSHGGFEDTPAPDVHYLDPSQGFNYNPYAQSLAQSPYYHYNPYVHLNYSSAIAQPAKFYDFRAFFQPPHTISSSSYNGYNHSAPVYGYPFFTPINPFPNVAGNYMSSISQPYLNKPPQRSCSPIEQPVVPIPVEEYLAQTNLEPETSQTQQPLLVILDMNGTLIHRKRRSYPPKFTKRPGLDPFLQYLFQNFKVMIWTSSQPQTVTDVLEKLLSPEIKKQLVGVWSRKHLDLTPRQYKEKVQVYKRLDKVWKDEYIQSQYPRTSGVTTKAKSKKKKAIIKLPQILGGEGQVWDQTNTVLVDDSKLKAAGQPHNIIEIPEFTNDPEIDEVKNLASVIRQLDILSRERDVSRKLRVWNQQRPELSNDSPEVNAFWEKELSLSSIDAHWLQSQEEITTAEAGSNNALPDVEQSVTEAGELLDTDLHITNSQPDIDGMAMTASRAGITTVRDSKKASDGKPKMTKGQKRAAKRAAARLKTEARKGASSVESPPTCAQKPSLGFLDEYSVGATITTIPSESNSSAGGGVMLPTSH